MKVRCRMSEELKAILNDKGVFDVYDDTYDLIIHCRSEEEQEEVLAMLNWITDRDPTDDEALAAGDTGFICCISGRAGGSTYDRAIVMGECYYDDGQWYVPNGCHNKNIIVHGWKMPPSWKEGVSI